jgi:heterodisulfide reductase subunit A
MRTYGFGEDAYRDAMRKGAVFIRYEDEPVVDAREDGLIIRILEPTLEEEVILKADLLVLSTAIIPNGDNEKIAKMLKLPLSRDGFFLEAHMKLRPVDFASDGIFLAGLAHWPKSIEESISQASAAAARASTILSKEKIEAERIVASINSEICNGCGICASICAYNAIKIIEDDVDNVNRQIAEVNDILCKGCGACAGACPSGAMEQRGFRSGQILAMIDATMENI